MHPSLRSGALSSHKEIEDIAHDIAEFRQHFNADAPPSEDEIESQYADHQRDLALRQLFAGADCEQEEA